MSLKLVRWVKTVEENFEGCEEVVQYIFHSIKKVFSALVHATFRIL
jgi:hypothetical protein